VDVRARNNVVVMGRRDGPVVVLSHGFGCDQNLWRLVAPALAERFPVVLFDHVGAGRSDLSAWSEQRHGSLRGYADDVRELVQELDLRRVVFVGHSVSAMIGVLAVNDDPSRYAGLVLLTPSPRYVDDAGYRGGFSAADHRRLLRVARLQLPRLGRRDGTGDHGTTRTGRSWAGASNKLCRTDPRIARVLRPGDRPVRQPRPPDLA
jgi:sigma-B regulation protein RsbQ